MENIIINFTSDAAGLQPGIDALEQLNDADKAVADQAKKTMEAFAKRDKTVTDGNKASKKSIDDLVSSLKNIDKAFAGGFGNKVFAELRNNLKLTDVQWKEFYKNIIKNAKAELVTADQLQDIEQLTSLIIGAEAALESFGGSEEEVVEKSKSMKSQLRELKQQLQEMEDAGLDNTEAFEQLSIQAGKLQDQIGDTDARIKALSSDTFIFDALISGVSGLTGAFAVAQGATALFGDENEDLQQALLKVNAAMSILQGLQAVQNVLQKQSAASIGIDLILRRNQTAATAAQTLATEAQAGATVAATTAQKGLNLAFLSSPAGILLLGIAAITTALIAFGSEAEEATEKQTELNKAMLEGERMAESLRQKLLDTNADSRELKALEDRAAAYRASGKSQAEIIKLETQIAEKRRQIAEKTFLVWDNETNRFINRVEDFREANRQTLNEMVSQELRLEDLDQKIANTDSKKAKERLQKERDLLQSEYDLNVQNYEATDKQIKEYYSSIEDAANAAREQEKFFAEQGLKNATAYAQARIIIARQGSQQELDARINAIRTQLREELANVNLTSGERFKIEQQALKDIQKLRNDYEIQSIKNAKTAVDAKVLEAERGTKQELDFKLQSLELGYLAEITDKNKNVEQLLFLDAQYLRDREQLIKEFNQRVATDAINTRIADLNSTLSLLSIETVDQTNQYILDAKKKLIDEQAALEVLSIENSVLNEEQRRIRIKAVYDKALADKKELERQKEAAEIDSGLNFANALLQSEQTKAKRILDSENSTARQRKQAQFDYYKFSEGLIKAEELANEQRFENGLITFEQYLAAKLAIQQKYNDIDFQKEQEKIAKEKAVRDLAIQSAISLTGILFSISRKGYDDEMQQVRDLFDQKKISQEEYDNRVRQLRRRQAADEKAMAVFQTLLQQGPVVIEGFKKGGIFGIAAALTLFFTALSAVTSTQVPQFRRGKIRINGPGTETSDSIHARISKNESVINAASTKKHEAALRAINEDRFQSYLVNHELPKLYRNLKVPFIQQPDGIDIGNGFDYGRMAEAFATELSNNPHLSINMDEDGFTKSLTRGQSVTIYKNKKINA